MVFGGWDVCGYFSFFVVPSVWVVIIACVAGVGSPEPNFSTHPTPT